MSRSVDIGPRIGVLGEKEFLNSMKAIDSQISANNKQLKLLAAQYDSANQSTKNLAEQQKTLEESINAADNKVALLTKEYTRQKEELARLKEAAEAMTKEHGENSAEAEKATKAYLKQTQKVNALAGKLSDAEAQAHSFNKKLEENTAELAAIEQETGDFTDALEENEKQIEQSGETVQQFSQRVFGAAEELEDSTVKVEDNTEKLSRHKELSLKAGEAAKEMGEKVQTAGQLVTKAGDTIEKAGEKIGKLGTTLTVGVTTPIVTAATVATNSALDFEDSLANINTLLDDTENLEKYETKIKELSRETGKDLSTMSDGMYQAISSLGDGDDTADIFGTMAKSAKAGGAEVADAVSLISAGMKGYNSVNSETAELISDLAFMTAKLGVTTFPEMAKSMQPLFPLSSSLNLSYEELFGTMATLTGVTGNTSEVSTQLKAVFSNLIKPTENMTKLMKSYGYENGQAMIEAEGFSGVLDILKEATGGQSDKLGELFSSTEALTAITALTGAQCDTFKDKLSQMGSVAGTTDTAYQKLSTTGDDVRKVINEMKIVAVDFGEELIPALTPLLDLAKQGAEKLSTLSDREKETVVQTAAIAAAAGPAVKIAGSAVSAVGKVVSAGGKALSIGGKAVSLLGKATSAAGLLGTGLGGLAVAGAAVGVAVWASHEKMVQADIASHFGDIHLSATEVADVAERLTETDWTMKVAAVVEAKEELERLEEDIEYTKEKIEKAQWKVKIGLELTASEEEEYEEYIEQLPQQYQDFLSQSEYNSLVQIDYSVGVDSDTGKALSTFVKSFYDEANDKLAVFGKAMAATVNASFEDNVLLSENLHLEAIVKQMNEAMQEIYDLQAAGQRTKNKISLQMGGYGLDVESYNSLADVIAKNINDAIETGIENADFTNAEIVKKKLLESGATDEFVEKYYNSVINETMAGIYENAGQEALVGFDVLFGILENNFADELPQASENISNYVDDFYSKIGDSLGSMDSLEMWVTDLNIAMPKCSEAASREISEALKAIEPDKETLEEIRDECIAAGRVVPDSITEGLDRIYYYEAMSGNISGIYELMGKQIANDPKQFAAIRAAAESGTKIPKELGEAIAHNSNYVFDETTNMFTEVKAATEMTQEEMLEYLNGAGKELTEEYANALASEYGLVKKNGKWMIDKVAEGVQEATPAATETGKASVRTITGGMQSEADANPVEIKVDTEQGKQKLVNTIANWGKVLENAALTATVTLKTVYSTPKEKSNAIVSDYLAQHATGGIFTTPHVALVAEEPGGEAIIPLSPARRDSAIELLNETAAILGYSPAAYAAEMAHAHADRTRTGYQATPTPAQGGSTVIEKGAIQAAIYTQSQNPDALYKTFTRRMTRDVNRLARKR